MIAAVIFDMDGVLIDSEPLWQEAEIAVFATVGLHLDRTTCLESTGLRSDEMVAYWHRKHPWTTPSQKVIEQQIVSRLIDMVTARGTAKEGVAHAIAFVKSRGVKVALASSSASPVISAVVARLGLGDEFDVVQSAETEPYGKPHPGVYITTAKRLDVPPEHCLAVEDSLNGVLSAKAAKMRCIVIPEGAARSDARFAIADVRLNSLLEIDEAVWKRLNT